MSDNLKTWPAKLYVPAGDFDEIEIFEEYNEDLIGVSVDRPLGPDVEYIRADLAQDADLIWRLRKEIAELTACLHMVVPEQSMSISDRFNCNNNYEQWYAKKYLAQNGHPIVPYLHIWRDAWANARVALSIPEVQPSKEPFGWLDRYDIFYRIKVEGYLNMRPLYAAPQIEKSEAK